MPTSLQSALFNFQSLLLVLLLLICTCAYVHQLIPAILNRDRNWYSMPKLNLPGPPQGPLRWLTRGHLGCWVFSGSSRG